MINSMPTNFVPQCNGPIAKTGNILNRPISTYMKNTNFRLQIQLIEILFNKSISFCLKNVSELNIAIT